MQPTTAQRCTLPILYSNLPCCDTRRRFSSQRPGGQSEEVKIHIRGQRPLPIVSHCCYTCGVGYLIYPIFNSRTSRTQLWYYCSLVAAIDLFHGGLRIQFDQQKFGVKDPKSYFGTTTASLLNCIHIQSDNLATTCKEETL